MKIDAAVMSDELEQDPIAEVKIRPRPRPLVRPFQNAEYRQNFVRWPARVCGRYGAVA